MQFTQRGSARHNLKMGNQNSMGALEESKSSMGGSNQNFVHQGQKPPELGRPSLSENRSGQLRNKLSPQYDRRSSQTKNRQGFENEDILDDDDDDDDIGRSSKMDCSEFDGRNIPKSGGNIGQGQGL